MCLMCEGKTEVEMIAACAAKVRRKGWTSMHVHGTPSWTYTIGLRWSFDHPELIVTHPESYIAAGLLEHAVDGIRFGRRFTSGSLIETPQGVTARVGAVHHDNLAGEWFARWPHVAAACGHGTSSLRALQAVIDCCSCADCSSQAVLDRRCTPSSHTTVGGGRRRLGAGGAAS